MAITSVMRMQTVLTLRVAIFACAHLDSLEMAPHAMVHIGAWHSNVLRIIFLFRYQ